MFIVMKRMIKLTNFLPKIPPKYSLIHPCLILLMFKWDWLRISLQKIYLIWINKLTFKASKISIRIIQMSTGQSEITLVRMEVTIKEPNQCHNNNKTCLKMSNKWLWIMIGCIIKISSLKALVRKGSKQILVDLSNSKSLMKMASLIKELFHSNNSKIWWTINKKALLILNRWSVLEDLLMLSKLITLVKHR